MITSAFVRPFSAVLAAATFLTGCRQEAAAAPREQLAAVVVNQYPHDAAAFTQGLAWDKDKGAVYESTGLYGQSSLRRVDLLTGRTAQRLDYEPHIFSEGLTVFQDSIYQLTWTNGVIFQYDRDSFALRKAVPWPREGWGLTHDGSSLIVSDGTATLYFLDPASMAERRRLAVHDGSRAITQLNELEYIKDSIYANIWKECQIAVISPNDGTVTAWIDLAPLCRQMQHGGEDVLNGIMHDPAADRIFVTGKHWPVLSEIKTVPSR